MRIMRNVRERCQIPSARAVSGDCHKSNIKGRAEAMLGDMDAAMDSVGANRPHFRLNY